ncbi:hypothetical protein BC941DRAFT_468602 [Chlamydoabsidia padenii]|nr:hypothetical protein BC941DRAFT_468602 [Chlamydoabsidia padenii]
MVINLLKRFLMNTLRISEMQKLDTIVYMICQDLKSVSHADVMERELFTRHYIFMIWTWVTVDFFTDCIPWHHETESMVADILPGECESTCGFLDVQNRFFKVFMHSSIRTIVQQVQRVLLGDRVELTMDMVLRFDQLTRQWWQHLPDELRLCDDPYNFDNVMIAIQHTRDDAKLILLLYFLDMVGGFHSFLIKFDTRNDNDSATTVGSDVLALIQAKSIKICLDFSETLIIIVNKLDSSVAYTQFLSDTFLFVAVDVLASLAFSDDPMVSLKAKQKLSGCFFALDNADFMIGNKVPLLSSPLNTDLFNTDLFNTDTSILHLYNQYPQPRYALLYDICRFLSPTLIPLINTSG